jgi:hypothetical protein
MNLCACVREEGGDGEGVDSEVTSLISYTIRFVSLTEVVTVTVWVTSTDSPVCMCDRGGWGRGGCGLKSVISTVIHTHLDTSVSWRWSQSQFGFSNYGNLHWEIEI